MYAYLMTSNQRLTVTLSVLASIAFAFILGFAIGDDDTSYADNVLFGCAAISVSEASGHTDDYIALLRSMDYFGRADDNREMLYSPGCIE